MRNNNLCLDKLWSQIHDACDVTLTYVKDDMHMNCYLAKNGHETHNYILINISF